MDKNCGIYYIQNIITNQIYIGQSKRIKQRKQKHFFDLRNNKHPNTYLQNSFNKYGEENFKFSVVEYCSVDELDELEIAYMNFYNVKKHGFNICDGGVHVCPDNSNENHGMYRKDINNDLIRSMYLDEYTSKEIAEYFNCSRRTINRRLRKIFGDEYDVLKQQKHLKGVKKADNTNPNIKNEDIVKLATLGFNSTEIASIIKCSDSTVMDRLKKIWPLEKYETFKKRNYVNSMNKVRARVTKESHKKIAEKHKKYSLWDGSYVHYVKTAQRFYTRFNSKDVHIGGFMEFVSPQLVADLISEYA